MVCFVIGGYLNDVNFVKNVQKYYKNFGNLLSWNGFALGAKVAY